MTTWFISPQNVNNVKTLKTCSEWNLGDQTLSNTPSTSYPNIQGWPGFCSQRLVGFQVDVPLSTCFPCLHSIPGGEDEQRRLRGWFAHQRGPKLRAPREQLRWDHQRFLFFHPAQPELRVRKTWKTPKDHMMTIPSKNHSLGGAGWLLVCLIDQD